jgi:hypothetical protein
MCVTVVCVAATWRVTLPIISCYHTTATAYSTAAIAAVAAATTAAAAASSGTVGL